ncbi:MAG: serine/threonine protein kinase [Symploca sp. SIO2C1]|nr:serine/threonine protein kinase [Symploca sp. SIO2C1]
MNLTPGTTINKGKYILDTKLGNGVFSLTYQATSQSNQTVVLKTLPETLCQHPDFDKFRQQFLKFVLTLKRCQHPHLVSLLDYFEEAGRPYLVMEYIPGQTLAQIIQTQVLSERKVFKYIYQVGDALNTLHQFGLLHRDIKPQNIILRQDSDCVVLCELGITCELTPGAMQTHASLLSSGYVPPEQYSPEYKRTKATDIYALAATCYCLLTGAPPLPVPVRKVLQAGESDDLFSLNSQQSPPKLTTRAIQAIRCALELAPEKRPQTVEAWFASIPLPKRLRRQGDTEIAKQEDTPLLKSGYHNKNRLLFSPSTQNTDERRNGWGKESVDTEMRDAPDTENGNATQNFAYPQNTSARVSEKRCGRNDKQIHGRRDAGKRRIEIPRTLKKTKALKPLPFKLSLKKLPLKALLMTGAIAASAGIGFGFALRFNSPNTPGSTILHTEQSFPPRSDWPVSEPSL